MVSFFFLIRFGLQYEFETIAVVISCSSEVIDAGLRSADEWLSCSHLESLF